MCACVHVCMCARVYVCARVCMCASQTEIQGSRLELSDERSGDVHVNHLCHTYITYARMYTNIM